MSTGTLETIDCALCGTSSELYLIKPPFVDRSIAYCAPIAYCEHCLSAIAAIPPPRRVPFWRRAMRRLAAVSRRR